MDLTLQPDVDNYRVRIYRPAPAAQPDQWPEDKLPLVVFSPGACLSVITQMGIELYRHLFEPLVEQGFVVLANDVPVTWNVSKRMRAMFCTLVWARTAGPMGWTEAGNDRLNCDTVAMGHSRGGEAAYNVVDLYPGFEAFASGLELKAAVGIAPRVRTQPAFLDPDILSGDIPASRVVPYLTLMGGNDGDVWGQALHAYDRMGPEEGIELPAADKVLLWAYDVIHGTWGGQIPEVELPASCVPPPVTPTQVLKGHMLAATFIPMFLGWQILGNTDLRSTFTRVTARDVSDGDFPPEVSDPLFWQSIDPEYLDLDMRPLIYADYTVPSDAESGRLLIDTMTREGVAGCKALTPSTLGLDVEVSGLDPAMVCIDRADNLKRQMISTAHETDAMRVTWEPSTSGSVGWTLDEDASDHTHLSLRIGRTAIGSFAAEPTIEGIQVRLVSDVDGQIGTGTVILERLIRQDRSLVSGLFPQQSEMMHTVRIPLREFCAQGVELEHLTQLSLIFTQDVSMMQEVLVDSLELTRSPADVDGGC